MTHNRHGGPGGTCARRRSTKAAGRGPARFAREKVVNFTGWAVPHSAYNAFHQNPGRGKKEKEKKSVAGCATPSGPTGARPEEPRKGRRGRGAMSRGKKTLQTGCGTVAVARIRRDELQCGVPCWRVRGKGEEKNPFFFVSSEEGIAEVAGGDGPRKDRPGGRRLQGEGPRKLHGTCWPQKVWSGEESHDENCATSSGRPARGRKTPAPAGPRCRRTSTDVRPVPARRRMSGRPASSCGPKKKKTSVAFAEGWTGKSGPGAGPAFVKQLMQAEDPAARRKITAQNSQYHPEHPPAAGDGKPDRSQPAAAGDPRGAGSIPAHSDGRPPPAPAHPVPPGGFLNPAADGGLGPLVRFGLVGPCVIRRPFPQVVEK